jgi:hypothetical protein
MAATLFSLGQLVATPETLALLFPATTAAKVIAETTLGSVNVGDGFRKGEGAIWTEAGTAGAEPLLTIRAGVRLGALKLRAT